MAIDLNLLSAHAARLSGVSLEALSREPARAERMRAAGAGIELHYGRQRLDGAGLDALFSEARRLALKQRLHHLFAGSIVNPTEGRPALHTALRSDLVDEVTAKAARAEVQATLERMERLSAALEGSSVTDVISVGIGGSDLGPRLVVDALSAEARSRFRVHFLANVDGHAAARLLPALDPSRTAVVLVSKSFGTQETLLNGQLLRAWLRDDTRLYAVSANVKRAAEFGVAAERVLPMWDAVTRGDPQ